MADEQLRLSEMLIGEIDAKNEILRQSGIDGKVFSDGFLIPSHYRDADFDKGATMFLVGFKGTGKTSLLRWMGSRRTKDGKHVRFILFKSDILEEDRQAISRGVWFELINTKSEMSGLHQDFKYAWIYILIQKIFESAIESGGVFTKNKKLEALASILQYEVGFGRQITLKRKQHLLPKITSGKVEISAKSGVIDAGVSFELMAKDRAAVPFNEFVKASRSALLSADYTSKKLFIFVDELEAFATSQENFDRDIRMIRDLLFAVYDMNRHLREASIPIYIVAAVRSEVLAVVNKIGEEVGRAVQDFSFNIDWSAGPKTGDHPLIKIISRKIKASEINRFGGIVNHSPMGVYFPNTIGGVSIYKNLLDSSMYRPRDLVRRLRLVRERFPNERTFGESALRDLFPEYSRQMWQEVSEELVPGYTVEEVNALERALAGFKRYFYRRELEAQLAGAARFSAVLKSLIERHPVDLLLQDLFRLGVVGNDFSVKSGGRTERRNRWSFRGDTTLATDQRMTFHRSLWPHLSLVDARPEISGRGDPPRNVGRRRGGR